MSDLLSEAEQAPEKTGRSKLEPVAEVVATLRRKRWSYRQIADFLSEKANLTVDPSTIFDFANHRQREIGEKGRRLQSPYQERNPKNETATPTVPVDPVLKTPISPQKRSVYIPRATIPPAFDPASLKTNDESDE